MSGYSEDKNKIEELIRLSKNISQLYEQLSDAEFFYGKDSNDYKRIVRNIDLSIELENELKDALYGDPELLMKFKSELIYKGDFRNIELFAFDPVAINNLYYASKCAEYDSLRDYGRIYCSKEKYLEKEYEPAVRSINIKAALMLLEQKTYIKLLDVEISRCKDIAMKRFLIGEKNKLLSRNPMLESWYFSFFKRDEALFIEDDLATSTTLGIDINLYWRFKKEYFGNLVDGVENGLLSRDEDDDDKSLRVLKLHLISALANMDASAISEKYNDFYANIFDGKIGKDSKEATLVDQIYSEYPDYVKRLVRTENKDNR